MCANVCLHSNSIAANTSTLEKCVGVLRQKVGWGNTCDVAESLLQAELLLYTVVYCELDHRWHWVGCITCNGYAVTMLLHATLSHAVRSAFRDSELAAYRCKTACKNAESLLVQCTSYALRRSSMQFCRLLCRNSSTLLSACRTFAELLVGSSLSSAALSQ